MTTENVNSPAQQTAGDPNVPVQQVTTPSNPQEDWKPRYDGAVRKMQELTETIKSLQGQLETKSSEIEQLNTQLSSKDAEFGMTRKELEEKLNAFQTENEQAKGELSKLRAFNTKVEVAKELGHPELIKILDTFPDTDDKDSLKKSMELVANFTLEQVKSRETELTAGVTPNITAPAGTPLPKTAADWDKYIQSLPPGEKRNEAWDLYFKSITKQE